TVTFKCTSATTIPFTSTITISQNVTLDASTSPYPITFDGGGSTQLLLVNGGSLGLDGLTLAHGTSGSGQGGALYLQSGSATVTNSTFAHNAANNDGGAIYDLRGTLSVTNSTFAGNSTFGSGGAIFG